MFRRNRKISLSALELLEKHEEMLSKECMARSQQVGVISTTLADNWDKTIAQEADFIISVARGREALRKTIEEMKKGKGRVIEAKTTLRYQISSLFLRDSWEYLKSDPRHQERLHLITGTITPEGTRVLSRMEQVKYDRQSAAYVSADKVETHKKIVSLSEEYGHLVLGAFHSHVSHGMEATTPSSIDRSFLARMSQIGCDCLGGIFSLDGFVRFFTASKDFEIEVYGSGVKKVEEDASYKIFQVMEVKDRERKGI
jgi:hypothetical protein